MSAAAASVARPARTGAGVRAWARYGALGLLLAIAVGYWAGSLEYRFPQWFGIERVDWPFLLDSENQPYFQTLFVTPSAFKAGIRNGDLVLAVNGIPITSRLVYADLIAAARPGETMPVTFERNGKRQTTNVTLQRAKGSNDADALILIVAMPALCLGLGFWVAMIRPGDIRAWVLLALMLGIASLFSGPADFWSPAIRIPAIIYKEIQQNFWLVWLLLLGVYFPEPFPVTRRWKGWRIFLLITVLGWSIFAASLAASYTIELHSLDAAFPIDRFLVYERIPAEIFGAAMVVGFLFLICSKYSLASSADVKRRLRVLYAGAAASLLPVSVLSVIAASKNVAQEEYFPQWLNLAAYLMFCLLPITLAYVIVVQRALDVRLAIRQGLRYALARRGVLVLQVILSAALFIAVAKLLTEHVLNAMETAALLAAGLCGILLLHGAAQRATVWIDKRFFRDAYNAEQILAELAETVRTIVETRPLLETVTSRIAESLRVHHAAVLLDGENVYRPVHCVGVAPPPDVTFAETSATVQTLKKEKQPVRVYFDDSESWIYRSAEMSEEERGRLAALKPEILVPLAAKDEFMGFISLGPKLAECPYSGTDLRLLNSVASQTGLALEVARLSTQVAKETAQRERLNRELEIAWEVQQHIFPQHNAPIVGIDYFGCCRPAREVGGDYYDFVELPGGRLGLAIGDVSGKGVGPALMMASLAASLRAQASLGQSLPEMMQRINRLVYRSSSSNRYATFFYGEYDPSRGEIVYVNAGHNPPLVLRRKDDRVSVSRLETGGMVIGLLPECSYEQGTFALETGDVVVLFTDGITESMNGNDEEWGEERLIECCQGCLGNPAQQIANCIVATATAFASGAPQHDDMTVVVLKIKPEPGS